MNELARVTTTKTDGWQTTCLQWSEAGATFKIRGIGARHLAFCKEICDRYRYKCTYDSGDKEFAAIFVPLA